MADLVTTTIKCGVQPEDGSPPWQYINADPENWTHQWREIEVENIRGKEDTVSLDTAGFQFYVRPAKYKGAFTDGEEIRREYYPESEELIKELTGASKVVFFDNSMCRCGLFFSLTLNFANSYPS